MNKKSKILSVLTAVIMILLSFGSVSAFADGGIPVKFTYEVKSETVRADNAFSYKLGLDFNDADIEMAGGITVFRCVIRFDPSRLEIVDYDTAKPIEFTDGTASSGTLFKYGDNISPSAVSYRMSDDGASLVILYGERNESITRPGNVLTLAFRTRDDIAFDTSTDTAIEIKEPTVAVDEEGVEVSTSAAKLDLRLTTPFDVPNIGSIKQNSALEIDGKAGFGSKPEEKIKAEIIKDGTVIREAEAETSMLRYAADFGAADEADFPVGKYMLKLTYKEMTAGISFSIIEKDKTPDPTNPTDPDDGKKDDDKKDDNNTGGGTNTGGSRNNGTGGTNQTKPDNTAEPNKPADSGNKQQTTIKYPSDLAGHWAESNVKYVYDNALMNGYSDGTFKPDASITRAEFSAVMARFLKLDDKASAAEKFGDVKGHWAIGYIGALADKGIVGGVIENSFAPDDNITREQMAAILSRAFDLKETSPELFADNGEISDWAHDYVYACRKAGYMNGDAANNFSPLDNASRAEVATVIYRLHSAK